MLVPLLQDDDVSTQAHCNMKISPARRLQALDQTLDLPRLDIAVSILAAALCRRHTVTGNHVPTAGHTSQI